jgi:thioredoxin-like negative regulator of GroEL
MLEGADLGVPIDSIDVDEGYELSRQYGVRAVPTLILLQCEKEVGRLNGAKTLVEIQEWINQH